MICWRINLLVRIFLLFSKHYYKLALAQGALFYTKLYLVFLNVPHAVSLLTEFIF